MNIPKPKPGEYNPVQDRYFALVPDDGQVLQHLAANAEAVEALMRSFSDEARTTPHAPGEWTVQEIFGHILDSERIGAYRIMSVARGEQQNLLRSDVDGYMAATNANTRDIDNMLAEYRAVRASTLAMVKGFTDEILSKVGTAAGHPLSVTAGIYMICGHEQHHVNSIHENYVSS